MILLLLAPVALAASDPDLMAAARAKLSAPCEGPQCAAPPAGARFRIADDDDRTDTAKDRAIGDDGSKCNVVGARRCTKRGRTLFRADLGQ